MTITESTISVYSHLVEYNNEKYEEKKAKLLEKIEKLYSELKDLEAEKLQQEINTFRRLKLNLESISDPDPVIIEDDDFYHTR